MIIAYELYFWLILDVVGSWKVWTWDGVDLIRRGLRKSYHEQLPPCGWADGATLRLASNFLILAEQMSKAGASALLVQPSICYDFNVRLCYGLVCSCLPSPLLLQPDLTMNCDLLTSLWTVSSLLRSAIFHFGLCLFSACSSPSCWLRYHLDKGRASILALSITKFCIASKGKVSRIVMVQ